MYNMYTVLRVFRWAAAAKTNHDLFRFWPDDLCLLTTADKMDV